MGEALRGRALEIWNLDGGLGSGEGLRAGELLFGFGFAAEAMEDPAKEEGRCLGVWREPSAKEHLGGGFLVAAKFFQAKGELLVREGVAAGELNRGRKGLEGVCRVFLREEEDAEVEVRLRVLVGVRGLGGDGLAVGGDGFLGLTEALVGEAEVVTGLDVVGVQAKGGEEGLPGIVRAIEVVVGPAEQIPGVGIRGSGAGGEQKPALGVGEVFQEDVVRGDDGEFVRGRGCETLRHR